MMFGWLSDAEVRALAPEAFDQVRGVAEILRDDLDRHLAVERDLVRQVHGGHAAAAQFAVDLVFAQRHGAQECELVQGGDRGGVDRRHGNSDKGLREPGNVQAGTGIRKTWTGDASAREVDLLVRPVTERLLLRLPTTAQDAARHLRHHVSRRVHQPQVAPQHHRTVVGGLDPQRPPRSACRP
jgi:hypothetical protein